MNIYDSIVDAVQELDPATRGEVYTAVIEYLRYEREPDLESMSQMARVLFRSFKPNLDNQVAQSKRAKKPRAGRRKGADGSTPSRTLAESEPNASRKLAESEPNASRTLAESEPNASEQEQEQEQEKDVNVSVSDETKTSSGEAHARKAGRTDECGRVIGHLNAVTGARFSPSSAKARRHIGARMREGHTVEELCGVVDVKAAQWLGGDMAKYLRPETLFGSKFEAYLSEWARAGPADPLSQFDLYEPMPEGGE